VHERAKEINTFSSVGLNPGHVSLLFLIEAIVYAAVASVLGYFIGIALLHFFREYGLLPKNFYPNYLGVFVLYSIGLAMFATISSSLYPMRIAAKMANPSEEKQWKIAEVPTKDTWFITLPFIASTQDEVYGVFAFISDFMSFHSAEGVGNFVTQTNVEVIKQENGDDAIKAMLWLSPFERGLVMSCALIAVKDKNRWNFAIDLQHLTGPRYLWLKSTRSFLDVIRNQMLIWRSISDAAILNFSEKGKKQFGAEQTANNEKKLDEQKS
jgi:hypothetical protein